MIFSDSASMLKGISNSSTMNNTSSIIQMLKNKIETGIARKNHLILLDLGELWS
jgi:hypothetical protein